MRLASMLPSSEIFLFIQRLKSSFPLKQTATTTTSRGGQLYSEEANALAMDFNGITVDDGSDADDAILRDRTQYDGRSEQQAKGFSAA
jgi:hypothetical protein